MNYGTPDVAYLASLTDESLYAELGKSVRASGLGMLPSDGGEEPPDEEAAGRSFFSLQFDNIRKLYCTEAIAQLVRDEQKRDIATFVSTLIDLFAAYFGHTTGTILLVQIHKIGVERFCAQEHGL